MRRNRLSFSPPGTVLPLPYVIHPQTAKFEARLLRWLNGEPFFNEGSVSLRRRAPEYSPPGLEESDACRKEVLEQVLPSFLKLTKPTQSGGYSFQQLMDPHKLSLVAINGRIRPVFTGKRAPVAWATLMLFGMLEQERLSLLGQCKCDCGKWLLKWRKDRQFATPACRVRCHQSNEEFKKKRNENDREKRQQHRDGKVVTKRPKAIDRKKRKSPGQGRKAV
jgi:hypothetical protein